MRRQRYTISYFICPGCGNSIPLPRKCSSKREKGHIKSLFCVYCNEITQTQEIRRGDAFIKENGNYIYA